MQLKIDSTYSNVDHITKYFIIDKRLEIKNDKMISDILNMNVTKYRKILMKQFHARQGIYSTDCFFVFKEHANQALEWVESVLIVNKLI